MRTYFPQDIESKWQKKWEENKTWKALEDSHKEKFYCLDMFPYPSGAGLHVGHPEGYTASDIVSRYKRMKGFNVLHPMGWDAFGLPAENYAIKKGIAPDISTQTNIETFTRQVKSFGFSYDWDREINTSSPEYYKWTQWMFLQMYKNNLAYKKKAAVNWCPSCKTVLANEQVVDGLCERCSSEVEQKELKQWFLKITKYAEELRRDLKKLNWSDKLKTIQTNWIGKSTGINIDYELIEVKDTLTVFTTRPDTNFGATFIVVAPDSDFVKKYHNTFPNKTLVNAYVKKSLKKTERERIAEGKKKTGVFTGWNVINKLNNKKLPIYISDFVLASVGTGAVVGVPGHDVRDFEFAKSMDLEIVRVVVGLDGDTSEISKVSQVQEEAGTMINSDFLNGLDIRTAKEKIMDYLEKQGMGKRTVRYKLRDWLISRQRYWGAPIPIVYCEDCGELPVSENDLPVLLPKDVDFKPTGESPLKSCDSFYHTTCPKCKKKALREADTMDTFVCSSWYFLRYTDSKNNEKFADADKIKKWMPVDLYVGGIEHAVLHLLYARFFVKALRDFGFVDFDEPFIELKNQGLILGPDNQKMSKSKGNVINPDEVIEAYGADATRMYEMFMGPFEDIKPWSTEGIKGIYRFLQKMYGLMGKVVEDYKDSKDVIALTHKTIKKVTQDIESFHFNTAISSMMILTNEFAKQQKISKGIFSKLVLIASPFAPHVCEELWEELGHSDMLAYEAWPDFDEKLTHQDTVTIAIQINGKVRGELTINVAESKENIEKMAKENQTIIGRIKGKKIKKVIVVPGKIINIVVQE